MTVFPDKAWYGGDALLTDTQTDKERLVFFCREQNTICVKLEIRKKLTVSYNTQQIVEV